MNTTQNSRDIKASPEEVFASFSKAGALEKWLAPGSMTGKVHQFDFREGGGYEMSLYYPSSEKGSKGKTTEKEDRFTARFITIEPNRRITQAINFKSADPAFAGEMIMEMKLEPIGKNTRVIFTFTNIPPGIKPEDNAAGTIQSLEKLASYVE